MPVVLLVEQQVHRFLILGRDLVHVNREAVPAPAVGRGDHVLAVLCSQQRELGRHEVVEHVAEIELGVVDRLDQTLLGVEARPEAVRHHQVEVLGAAGPELVPSFGVAVEEPGADLDVVPVLELGGQALDVVVLPAEPAQLQRGCLRISDEGAGALPGEARNRCCGRALEDASPRHAARRRLRFGVGLGLAHRCSSPRCEFGEPVSRASRRRGRYSVRRRIRERRRGLRDPQG